MMMTKMIFRLLHVSPSPEELTITEQLAKEEEQGANTLETYLRPLILKSSVVAAWEAQTVAGPGGEKSLNPALKVNKGPLPPRMMMHHRPRSPYPPAHLIQSGKIRGAGSGVVKGPLPNGARFPSPPFHHRGGPMFYRMPSPTAGLIRVTPRHLPPTAFRMGAGSGASGVGGMGSRPRMLTPSPISHQRNVCQAKSM